MPPDYTKSDLEEALEAMGVGEGEVVALYPDLRWMGRFEHGRKQAVLEAYWDCLNRLIDLDAGTLVVPTASVGLCGGDEPFSREDTPTELGVLNEFVRRQAGAVRSLHPFISHAAVGKHASEICEDVARNCFGPHSAMARMVERDALCVSIGLHPRRTCEVVHHAELLMNVPYRYCKEFMHPIKRGESVVIEPFYMYVWYKGCGMERDGNLKIWQRFLDEGHQVRQASLGKGQIYAYRVQAFLDCVLRAMKEDIFIWLRRPLEIKPYRK